MLAKNVIITSTPDMLELHQAIAEQYPTYGEEYSFSLMGSYTETIINEIKRELEDTIEAPMGINALFELLYSSALNPLPQRISKSILFDNFLNIYNSLTHQLEDYLITGNLELNGWSTVGITAIHTSFANQMLESTSAGLMVK